MCRRCTHLLSVCVPVLGRLSQSRGAGARRFFHRADIDNRYLMSSRNICRFYSIFNTDKINSLWLEDLLRFFQGSYADLKVSSIK